MRFAVEATFTKEGDEVVYTSGRIVSDYHNIHEMMTGIEYDVFNPNVLEGEQIKTLKDGDYSVFLFGEYLIEHETEPESGRTETSFIFLADEEDIIITPIKDGKHEPKQVNTSGAAGGINSGTDTGDGE